MSISYLVVALIFYLISIFLFNIYELDEDTSYIEYFISRIFLLLLSLLWVVIVPAVLVVVMLSLTYYFFCLLVILLEALISFLIKKFRKN